MVGGGFNSPVVVFIEGSCLFEYECCCADNVIDLVDDDGSEATDGTFK